MNLPQLPEFYTAEDIENIIQERIDIIACAFAILSDEYLYPEMRPTLKTLDIAEEMIKRDPDLYNFFKSAIEKIDFEEQIKDREKQLTAKDLIPERFYRIQNKESGFMRAIQAKQNFDGYVQFYDDVHCVRPSLKAHSVSHEQFDRELTVLQDVTED